MQTIMILTVCRTDQSTLETTNETLLRHLYIRRRLNDYGRTREAELRWWSTHTMWWRQTTPARITYVDDAVSASAVSVLHF